MSNPLPALVQKEWEVIQSQSHLTAKLLRIGKLLHALERSRETERYFFELSHKIHAKRTNMMAATKKSMKWLADQFDRLNQSIYSDCIKRQALAFTELIQGKKYALGVSVVRQSRDLLNEASSKCSNLKNDPDFENFLCKDNQIAISWPDYLIEAIANSVPKYLEEYEKNLTSDPVDLLEFLQLLTEYRSYDSLQSIQSFMKQQTQELDSWQSVENNNCQLLLKIYFQRFGYTNDYPVTDERLLELIKAFLDLFILDIQSNSLLCGPQLKSKLSKDAERFCIDALLKCARRLTPEKLRRFTYEKMRSHCLKAAYGQRFLHSITRTLIENKVGPKVRNMLKTEGIDPKVVRGKAS